MTYQEVAQAQKTLLAYARPFTEVLWLRYSTSTADIRIRSVWTMQTCKYLCLFILLTTRVPVDAFDPISTTVVVGVCATLGRSLWNYLTESCDSRWIAFNATGEHVAFQFGLYLV